MSERQAESDAVEYRAPEGWVRRELRGIPASLGAVWTRRVDGAWRYAALLDDSHANALGTIHGGVLMSFFDHAMSLLVWEACGRAACATVQLDCQFLEALKPPVFVELDATILKMGRGLAFARGRLRAGDVGAMEASGVWRISAPAP